MRGHPWFLWRRQSIPGVVGNNGNYRGFMPWFRYASPPSSLKDVYFRGMYRSMFKGMR